MAVGTQLSEIGSHSGAMARRDEVTLAERSAINKGGVALVANGVGVGTLGLAYWVVAAHLFGPVDVGQNSSLVSALVTISGIAQLNYARSLSGLIPRAGSGAKKLVARVYLWVCGASLVLGAALATVLTHLSERFGYLKPADLAIPGFALAVVLWSVFTLEDAVLTATRRSSIVPLENFGFGVAKLALLFVFAKLHAGNLSIFASWVLPLVLIVTPINIFTFKRALPAMSKIPAFVVQVPGRWVRLDYAGYMFWLFGTSPLPFLVLAALGPKPAAAFYVPLTIASAIDVVSLNVGNIITAEMSRNSGSMSKHTAKFVLGYSLLVLIGSIVILLVAPTLLQIFGGKYKAASGVALRLMLGASSLRALMFLCNAAARAQGRGGRILVVQAVSATGTLVVGFATMSHLGPRGMAMGWLAGSLLSGLFAFWWLAPIVVRGWSNPRRHSPDDKNSPAVTL